MKLSSHTQFRSLACLAAAATACLTIADAARATVIVSESFGGLSTAGLNGTAADTFDGGIVAKGGSATWAGNATFRANGFVDTTNVDASAYLNLGSYIDDAKGTDAGKFILQASISQTTGNWLSLGFAAEDTPTVGRNFTNSPVQVPGSTNGMATIIYRAQTASPPGELDMWLGPRTTPVAIDGPDLGAGAGTRTLSITLDLTPAGGYNGTTNHGTVTWADSALGVIGSGTYTSNQNFRSILLSKPIGTNPTPASTGTYGSLTLTQVVPVPEPGVLGLACGGFLTAFGLVAMRRRSRVGGRA